MFDAIPVVGEALCEGGAGSVLARDASEDGLLLGFVQPLNQLEPGVLQLFPLLHPAAEMAAMQTTAAATFQCENDVRIVSQSLVIKMVNE